MSSESPYAAPDSDLSNVEPSNLYSNKHHVICAADAEWPARCFKCNAETKNKKKTKLTYLNPWFYLTLLITPILTIILALIFQKKFTVELPVCDLHMKKRRNFLIIQWSLMILTIAGFLVGAATDSQLILVFSIVLLLVVVVSAIAGRMVHVAKYKENRLWVKGAGKEFLQSLSAFTN